MRYVVFGAGAVGGVIGGRLQRSGRDVVLIARGAHLEAMRRAGLRLQGPDGEETLRVRAVGSIEKAVVPPPDVIVLTVKSQDTAAAVEGLAGACPPETAVVCAQNGVTNERAALRRFRRVYGMSVYMPCSYLEPGVVRGYGGGVLDIGRYPSGAGETAAAVARDLESAGFSSQPRADIMRWKYGKLLANLANAIELLCGLGTRHGDLYARATEEARACYRAAGIAWASDEEQRARRETLLHGLAAGGRSYGGGSTWQSAMRGAARIEVDYLNGEIVLLGRLHGVPTPVNEALQRAANRLVREGRAPGSVPEWQLAAEADGR